MHSDGDVTAKRSRRRRLEDRGQHKGPKRRPDARQVDQGVPERSNDEHGTLSQIKDELAQRQSEESLTVSVSMVMVEERQVRSTVDSAKGTRMHQSTDLEAQRVSFDGTSRKQHNGTRRFQTNEGSSGMDCIDGGIKQAMVGVTE